jgi:predicted XRE-type DNA-binding protein
MNNGIERDTWDHRDDLPNNELSLRSIAISLKRIADVMEQKNIKQPVIMSAEEYAKFKAML